MSQNVFYYNVKDSHYNKRISTLVSIIKDLVLM